MKVVLGKAKQPPVDLVELEQADAWHGYRDETRNLIGFRYDEHEPLAWARLQRRLRTAEETVATFMGGAS